MKKIIKDTNLVPVNINDLVLDSQVSEGSMNPPTSDAVAAAIAGGGTTYTAGDGITIADGEISAKVDGTTIGVNASGELVVVGGGQLEIVEVGDISTRFASLDAIITEMRGGKFFVFHNLSNNADQWYIPTSYAPNILHCTFAIVNKTLQQDFGVYDLYIQYTSGSGFNIQTASVNELKFSPDTIISQFITTGLPQREYVCGELVCVKDGVSSSLKVYKCILTYTETTANRKPHQDPTHWAETTLGAEIQARVPAPTIADAGKVLTVDSQGAPGWAQASGGSTGYTRRAIGTVTDTDNQFSVTLNNKECATVSLSPSNTSRKNLLVTVANDCDDAILHYTVANQSTKLNTLRVMRGNTDLTIIYPPVIGYKQADGYLRSLLEEESGYGVPTDWSDVECGSALTNDYGVTLEHIYATGKYDVVLRIVADFCFVHPLYGDQSPV